MKVEEEDEGEIGIGNGTWTGVKRERKLWWSEKKEGW